jgi:methylmalonyl-CoA mutase N-terminal domain/subunit
MTINCPHPAPLCVVARRQGADARTLSGTIQNDILKEYIARGTYIYPPRASMRIVTDLFAWAGREMPEWNPISISGYHIREAGSTAVQEVAFTFANATAYIEAALAAGLAIDDFAPRLSFFFNAHSSFLEEIAKYRAARRLYAHLMRDSFNARNPKSIMLRFHVQTAGSTLTAQQPDVNVIRTSIEALAGAERRTIPHQFARRSAFTAHRGIGPPGSANAADHRLRERRHQYSRSRRRQ